MFNTITEWLQGIDLQIAVMQRQISLDDAFTKMYQRQIDALLVAVISTGVISSVISNLARSM